MAALLYPESRPFGPQRAVWQQVGWLGQAARNGGTGRAVARFSIDHLTTLEFLGR